MKKRILILAAVAVSGVAAVVAGNVNIAMADSECVGGLIEAVPTYNHRYHHWCCTPIKEHIDCGMVYGGHIMFIDKSDILWLD